MYALGVVAIAVSLTGCDLALGLETRGAPWLDGYAYRKRISVSLGAANGLAEFPVSIAFSDQDLAAHVGADGRDLVFTSAANEILAYEIVDYEAATGTVDAWVKAPKLAAGAITELRLYYGGAPRLSLATATWAADIEAVWHLSEVGPGSDSTSHGHELGGGASVAAVPGIVGGARGFDRQGLLTVGDPPDGSLDFGLSSFSISTWVRVGATTAAYEEVIFKGGNGVMAAGYSVGVDPNSWYTNIGDGSGDQLVVHGNRGDLGQDWTHLVAVVDRPLSELRAYTNGALAQTSQLTIGSVDTLDSLALGGSAVFPFAGSIDETRLYRRVLSADWIRAEYRNLALRTDSVLIADEEQR